MPKIECDIISKYAHLREVVYEDQETSKVQILISGTHPHLPVVVQMHDHQEPASLFELRKT